MSAFIPVEKFFEHVYLVDLSPSLCEVARQRFERLGWKNVTVLCQDARSFKLPEGQVDPREVNPMTDRADLVTMSYSLSMIPGECTQPENPRNHSNLNHCFQTTTASSTP